MNKPRFFGRNKFFEFLLLCKLINICKILSRLNIVQMKRVQIESESGLKGDLGLVVIPVFGLGINVNNFIMKTLLPKIFLKHKLKTNIIFCLMAIFLGGEGGGAIWRLKCMRYSLSFSGLKFKE